MKLHGKDKLMVINLNDNTTTEIKGCYRVIESKINRSFTAKYFDKDTAKYKNRRFSMDEYRYEVRKDPKWKPSTIRNPLKA